MVTLKNDKLSIGINTMGAELTSILNLNTNEEMLWQGDPTYWKRQAPILFPIVGSVWNNKYIYNGITYEITSRCVTIPGQNGHVQVRLENNGNLTTVLAETQDLADDILSRSTVKLLFNEQGMVTAIDE